jgi:hypothetical protein
MKLRAKVLPTITTTPAPDGDGPGSVMIRALKKAAKKATVSGAVPFE